MPDGRANNRGKKLWSDELVETELRRITGALGWFPSASDLTGMGMNSLLCAVTRRGGLLAWSDRLRLARRHSDSDTGWEGEIAVRDLFVREGIPCERSDAVKAPFDLLADGVLRVDVKAARYAEYRSPKAGTTSRGWFYRLGKIPQADLILLYQLDAGTFYGLPWWECPTGNVVISPGQSKYARFLNDWPLVREMIARLKEDRERIRNIPAA